MQKKKVDECPRHSQIIPMSATIDALNKALQDKPMSNVTAESVGMLFSTHMMGIQYARLALVRDLLADHNPKQILTFNELTQEELSALTRVCGDAMHRPYVFMCYSFHLNDWLMMQSERAEFPEWWLTRRGMNNAKAALRKSGKKLAAA